jgi:hypothetical protein
MEHQAGGTVIGAAVLLVVVAGPAAWTVGTRQRRTSGTNSARTPSHPDWRLAAASTLYCVLAFNLVFLMQEVLLVLPKAFIPGLSPTLFHNNHTWQGDDPRAYLLQGTGAVGILLLGAVCAALVRLDAARGSHARLLLLWTAYQGLLQSLPQFVVAGFGQGDVSQALDYLEASPVVRTVVALVAVAVLPPVGFWLARGFLTLAHDQLAATGNARRRFVWWTAVLPALAAVPLIVLFRIPRELPELLLPPAIAAAAGAGWMMAAAPRLTGLEPRPASRVNLVAIAAADGALLALFQLVLRRGIEFF